MNTRELRRRIRWTVRDVGDPVLVRRLADETGQGPLVCSLLVQRGVRTIEEARAFLAPKVDHFHDPFRMKDLERLVDALIAARERGDVVGIHGDYDVDGLTSTTLLARVLVEMGFDVRAVVPDRMIDGYGVSTRLVDLLASQGARVLLTCDTGISAHDELSYARDEHGMVTLVTDHHHPPAELPAADAIVNPHQVGCDYPFKPLSGAGVAFKVLQGLVRKLGLEEREVLYPYIDLAGLGTVCDVVSLRGENRILARYGLRVARQSRVPGMRALLEVAEVEPDRIDARTFGWQLGPRLNAVGRIDKAERGLELLMSDDEGSSRRIAQEVSSVNERRRNVSRAIQDEVVERLEKRELEDIYGLVLFGGEGDEGVEWHHGVLGIVAGRIVEQFGRPALLFARDPKTGKWKGSGRANEVGCVHLYEVLEECDEFIERFGGHAGAAGATLPSDVDQAAFADAFNAAMAKRMAPEDRYPMEVADAETSLAELDASVHSLLAMFAPFGHENEPIQMIARDVELLQARVVGKDGRHLKLRVRQGHACFDAIAFGLAERYPEVAQASLPISVDLLFELSENTWKGRTTLQLKVNDLKLRDSVARDPESAERVDPRDLFAVAGARA